MSGRTKRTLEVARKVAERAAELDIETAVIGAVALAVHGYPRATMDIDLACWTDPFTKLRELKEELERDGYETTLFEPDREDPLGGVLTVSGDDFGPVQVVNFCNPLSGAMNPGRDAISSARTTVEEAGLLVVDLEHLIALKLYAGGPKSRSDVIELLQRNPEAAREGIRAVCATFGLEVDWLRLLAESEGSEPPSPGA